MLLLLLLLIMPVKGIAGIELNPSDPQSMNSAMTQQCLLYTGWCVIWYPSGRYYITAPINLPHGIYDVYMEKNTILVPCGQPMPYLFVANSWPRIGERSPRFLYPDGT